MACRRGPAERAASQQYYFSVQAYARDHALAAHARSSNIKMVYA